VDVVLRIHNKWICCAAEWQNFRGDDSSDRRACLVHLALGCFLFASTVGTLGLARRAEPKIFLRDLVIRVWVVVSGPV